MSRIAVLALLLPLILPCVGARAEEGEPAVRFTQALDTLPVPSKALAFHFDGEIVIEKASMGTMVLDATPATLPSGEAGWRVTDERVAGTTTYISTALLDRRLQPIQGEVSITTDGKVSSHHVWMRRDKAFAIEQKAPSSDGDATAERIVPHEGDTLTTVSALMLFCRIARATEGTFATQILDASSPRSQPFEDATWTFAGEGTWEDKEARLVTGRKEDVELEAGFEKETRALLGAVFTRAPAMKMTLRPRSETASQAPPVEADPFAAPAPSAMDAAMTAALAFATGDLDLLEKITHWETVYAARKQAHEVANEGKPDGEPFPALGEVRAGLLAQLGKQLPKNPRPMIVMGLKMVKPQLAPEELEGGTMRVKFPAMFKNLVLDVAERNGKWYLVRIPGRR